MKKDMQDILTELRKIVPAENFRKQPDFSVDVLLQLEKKYNLNTQDFLEKRYSIHIEEEDVFDWLNEFENLVLFGGDATMVNSIS